VIERVTELQRTYEDVSQARRLSGQLAAKDDQLRDGQAQLRASHQDVLSRFDELFGYVCRGVLGNYISASVSLTGQGIQADVQVGGMAMESLKAIAFDLAALLMSDEGRTVVLVADLGAGDDLRIAGDANDRAPDCHVNSIYLNRQALKVRRAKSRLGTRRLQKRLQSRNTKGRDSCPGLAKLTSSESMVRRGGLEPPRDCSR